MDANALRRAEVEERLRMAHKFYGNRWAFDGEVVEDIDELIGCNSDDDCPEFVEIMEQMLALQPAEAFRHGGGAGGTWLVQRVK